MQQAAACARCDVETTRIASSTKLVAAQLETTRLFRRSFRRIFFTLPPSIRNLMRECIPRYC